MKRYVLSKIAENDLDVIKTYLTDRAGIVVTRTVMAELRAGMSLLGSQPEIGHVREDLTHEVLRFWFVRSYAIIYNPAPKPIEILRVLHGARDIMNML